MVLEISSTLLARLLNEAEKTPDREVCGLLFGTPARIEAVEVCDNVAVDPRRHFEIDPAALFAAIRAERAGGATLLGHWHSHPTGRAEPSATDAANAMGDGALWMIVTTSDARVWRNDRIGVFQELDLVVIA